MELEGIIPPILTAFHADGSLDERGTRDHAAYLREQGVDGIFALGTTGEAPLLAFPEKTRVIRAVVAEGGGRVPVLAGVGCPGTAETVALAREAEQAGADGLAVVTPYYYPPSPDGLLRHYTAVAEAVDLPLLLYHIPKMTGAHVPLETIERLAEIPNLIGMKDSTEDALGFYAIRRTVPDWTLLMGSDGLVLTGLALGADGAILALANAFPQLAREIYAATQEGDWDRAHRGQHRLWDARQALRVGPTISALKATLRLRGRDPGPVRSPLEPLEAEAEAVLRQRLEGLALL